MLHRNIILSKLLYNRIQSLYFFIRDIKHLSISQWEVEANDISTSYFKVRQQKVTK